SDEVIKSSVEDLVPIPSKPEGIPDTMCDVHLVNYPTPLEAKDHFKIFMNSNDDISSHDEDSLYNENIEYVEASPYDYEVVSLEEAEIVILKSPKSFLEEINTFHNSLPEFENFYFDLEEISSGSTTTHSDISLPDYEAFSFNNEHIKEISSGSPTTHSDISFSELIRLPLIFRMISVLLSIGVTLLMRSSPMNSLTSYLHRSMIVSTFGICPIWETNTFHNSLPKFENFYFDLGEISSGSTTTHSDISLLDYEAFYFDDDHVKEISSGSPTTQSGISLSKYDSFIFDLCPPSDRSDFYEFTDELSHIISPPEYDCFYFKNLPDPGELISIFNSGIHENPSATTRVNSPVEDDHSPLLTYVV
nr:hypothetical protein [Tanacetum cinerariifolium]